MFGDYKQCVLDAYHTKRASGKLAFNLVRPTPASLKKECMTACNQRFLKRDEKFLEEFFERKTDASGYLKVIRQFETDRFRPLCNFLKQKTDNTAEINIELLAWLIDFPSRPYHAGWAQPVGEETRPEAENEGDDMRLVTGESTMSDMGGGGSTVQKEVSLKTRFINAPRSGKTGYIFLSAILLLLTATIGCWIWRGTTETSECMYWTGDRYVPMSCNRKIFNKAIVAMDTMKLAHFRRINRPDTITVKALGLVWYSKIDGKVEFYTSDGVHPLHPERELKQLSKYMIRKYIDRKRGESSYK